MGCKSGCGGAISTSSHCKQNLFSDEELDMFPKLIQQTRINSQNKTSHTKIGYK